MNSIKQFLFLGFFILSYVLVHAQNPSPQVMWKEKGGKNLLCDINGHPLTDKVYDYHGEWIGNIAWIASGEKFGFINEQGKELIPTIYDNLITNFCEAGVMAQKEGKWGFINWQNEILLPFQYDFASNPYSNGLIGVNTGGKSNDKIISGGKWGFITKEGKIITPPKYDHIGAHFIDGLLWVNLGGSIDTASNVSGGKFGLIDSTGKEVLPITYQSDQLARQTYLEAKENVQWRPVGKQYALYDKKSNRKISKNYDKYWNWIEGKAGVSLNERYGYIDKTGKEMIPVVYEDIRLKYSYTGAFVKKNGKWGFLNWQGNIVLPFQYDILSSTHENGLIAANIGGKSVTNDGVVDGGKWGYVTLKGEILTPFKYDYTGSEWIDGTVWINQGGKMNVQDNSVSGGKFGLLDSTGTEVVPLMFDGNKSARAALKKGIGNQFNINDLIPENIWNY